MKSLHLLVEKTVVERYRVEVADDFPVDDHMSLEELFSEGEDKPEPYESRDVEVNVTVLDELDV